MKKRLRKAMLHIPLLKLRPELAEQDKEDQEITEGTENDDVVNGQCDAQVNVNDNIGCEQGSDMSRLKCCFCVKRMIFCSRHSENDEIPLVEMN